MHGALWGYIIVSPASRMDPLRMITARRALSMPLNVNLCLHTLKSARTMSKTCAPILRLTLNKVLCARVSLHGESRAAIYTKSNRFKYA